MEETVFLKLGGSLITDKARPATPRYRIIRRLAREVGLVLQEAPGLRLLIGHGSGSFGHQVAARFGTRQGVETPAQWRGLAEVAAAAARLNRIVADAFLQAGVPVLCLPPSASARCRDGALLHLETHPIEEALTHGLVPLVYGDVALDEVRGGTIVSTEEVFAYLAAVLRPTRILLAGSAPGVLDAAGRVIPHIAPEGLPALQGVLSGARETDVTGGMADKVARMAELVRRQPGLRVEILSGLRPGRVYRALTEPGAAISTCIA